MCVLILGLTIKRIAVIAWSDEVRLVIGLHVVTVGKVLLVRHPRMHGTVEVVSYLLVLTFVSNLLGLGILVLRVHIVRSRRHKAGCTD